MSELALAAGITRIDTGALPTDWKAMQLRDFCSFVQGGRLGLTKQDHYRSSGVPAFSAAGQDGYVDVVEFRDTDAVILSAIGANCGRCFLATGNWTTLANVQVIIPRPSDAIAPFLHYRVNRDDYWPRSGSAQPFIKPSDIRSCWVALPPVPQQAAIAKVLDTLDTAIHETEAIIAKLKAVKQGLLHDLLTRGIDANGELRPPQSEAPHLYKQSPLGWIPKDWTYKPFGDLCESSAFGPRFPSDAYDENGPLATLRTTDMDDEGNISLSTMPRAAIAPSVFADHLLRPGDLVISRSGTCGVTGVFAGHDIPVVPGAFLIRFRMRDIRLNRFYRRYFNSSQGRPYLDRLAVGGVQKNIKGSDVLCLLVPVPSPEEAIGIAERIESIEHDIESNRQLLTKLTLQKAGLMDDLLTGRVRVTPLLTTTRGTS
ncbi:restriction endonuclease subunit S [Tepidimonas taiwanensis]|uniref:restriction endonuclease subunit S n=1 Tax=Tepidimonas taiwanensis TaxID=307486 RepID=UPI0009EB50B6|nr:restriction endonuclease subunit S [Tepidimonas taiwanensis]